MITALYRSFLRLPGFRGKARIDAFLKRWLHSPALSTVHADLAMWLDPLEWSQATLIETGVVEPATVRLFEKVLGRGDVYVDVGAHVGFHTLVARRCVGPDGRVVAVEPQPYNCERILVNWQLNGFDNLDLHVAAAGAGGGRVELRNQAMTDKARLTLAGEGVNDLRQRFHVPLVTLDEILDAHAIGKVHLMKVDAEGYEMEVMLGLDRRIADVENLIVEVLPDPATRAAARALLDRLRERGFELRTVAGDRATIDTPLPENNLWATRWNDARVARIVTTA
jgi:FkbM family methyltransferase